MKFIKKRVLNFNTRVKVVKIAVCDGFTLPPVYVPKRINWGIGAENCTFVDCLYPYGNEIKELYGTL
ncbi:hypothetical protein SAMN05421766_103810 [Zobellia uliginosa]|uniref:Uncharacterized protein n=1 Tax=Zobellia uliginosa TaxID=143224 RepID=A0ABY1KTF3_9FLAO|nr:hypothetical protein SAMN05421766_103810 [Zobellia uliginosa]